jgi:predicted nucleic acid-binding protein
MPTAGTWNTILDLARQHKLSAYDATYLEIALRLTLPLASLDNELLVAAKSAGVEVFTHGRRDRDSRGH